MREEVSHRLRTPLTVIKTMLQYAERSWDDLTDEQKKEFVTQTLAQVDELETGIEVAEAATSALHGDGPTSISEQQQV